MATQSDVLRRTIKCAGGSVTVELREYARMLEPWCDSSSGFVQRKAVIFYETEDGDSVDRYGDEYVIPSLGGLRVRAVA